MILQERVFVKPYFKLKGSYNVKSNMPQRTSYSQAQNMSNNVHVVAIKMLKIMLEKKKNLYLL